MGSRAIVIVCRDPGVAKARFGIDSERGRGDLQPHRPDVPVQPVRLRRSAAPGPARVRRDPGSGTPSRRDWVLLDCELMPWSAKAIELIRRQYAAVGAAAHAGLEASISALEHAQGRGLDVAGLLESQRRRIEHIDHYVDAYRR